MRAILFLCIAASSFVSCNKNSDNPPPAPPPVNFVIASWSVNNIATLVNYYDVPVSPTARFKFPVPISRNSVASSISLKSNSGTLINYQVNYENGDSTITVRPQSPFSNLAKYVVSVSTQLKSVAGGNLLVPLDVNLTTSIDSSRKFPAISDDSLLTLTQQQTFKYFWDFGHPVSGLARERNTSGEIVTSGGSGFGIMAIITGVNRKFISRAEGLARMQKIVGFLKNTAQRFHGAFPHWLNGSSGVVIPFSAKDNGADLVETSYLFQGLLCARQYFNAATADETSLRNDIKSSGMKWNGTGSEKTMRMFCTGIGVRIIIGK